ncbi:hypothetical protein QJS10_CPB21g01511 [Acorus calamus]|nr:hypothetical protein QJS10_CPB21g01511 [Acorus calamus]
MFNVAFHLLHNHGESLGPLQVLEELCNEWRTSKDTFLPNLSQIGHSDLASPHSHSHLIPRSKYSK